MAQPLDLEAIRDLEFDDWWRRARTKRYVNHLEASTARAAWRFQQRRVKALIAEVERLRKIISDVQFIERAFPMREAPPMTAERMEALIEELGRDTPPDRMPASTVSQIEQMKKGIR